MKTVVEQLIEQTARAEAAEKTATELKAQVEAGTKALSDEKALNVQHIEAAARVKAEHEAALKASADALTLETAEHAAEKALREKAELALANPAHAQAAAVALKAATPEGSPASESVPQTLAEQMEAIENPRERRAFYLANRDAIKAEAAGKVN